MIPEPESSNKSSIAVNERGGTQCDVVGRAAWRAEDGRVAIVVTSAAPKGTGAERPGRTPSGEAAFGRIVSGQGRRSGEIPWAGLAWEPSRRLLHGIRDPLGEVPLFAAATEARAAIGSSPDAVIDALGIYARPNLERLRAFCLGETGDERDDFLQEVWRVRPGESVTIGPATVSFRDWWSAPDPRRHDAERVSGNPPSDPRDPLASLERHLIEALEPLSGRVTLALSGGIDSSLIATFLALRTDLDVRAIHLGSDRYPSADETEIAERLAGLLGFSFQRLSIDDLALEHAVDVAGPAPFPSTPLDQSLRRYATGTLVTGLGGDQLFSAGRGLGLKSMARNMRFVELARQIDPRRKQDWRAVAAGLLEHSPLFRELQKLRPDPDTLTAIERREPWMKPGTWIAGQIASRDEPPLHLSSAWEEVVRNATHADRTFGVSTLHPFLNPGLWSWAAGLPNHLRFRRGRDKWLLRQLLERRLPGRLGQEISERLKIQTFNAWAADRLAEPNETPFDSTLSESTARALVRPATFHNRYSAFARTVRGRTEDLSRIHSIALWRTLAADEWLSRLNLDA